MTPTAKSLKELRAQEYMAEVVERFHPKISIRQDLFGIADILAVPLSANSCPKLIQVTSGSNMAARIHKIQSHEHLQSICRHFEVEVWGWRKRGDVGYKKHGKLQVISIDYDSFRKTGSSQAAA